MFRTSAMLAAIVAVSACDTQPTANSSTLAQPGALGAVPVDTTRSKNGSYGVRISENRKVALVRALDRKPTIAGIEAAATEKSKCAAKVVENTYKAMGNDRNAIIPAGEFNKYGGVMPLVLTCS